MGMVNTFRASVMQAFDFHSHSIYSDGSLTPEALCDLAFRNGVTRLALTDHDSIQGLAEARAAAEKLGMALVNGVEMSVIWEKTLLHVVGLNIDHENPDLLEGLAAQAKARGIRARAIADKLAELKLGDSWESVLAMAGGDPDRVGRTHFARYLLESGAVRTLQQAFDRYLGTGKPAAMLIPWADLTTAIGWIEGAGGVSVLAHPARYGLSATKTRAMLAAFKAAGGRAMEVSTANERPNVVANLAQLAQRHDLHASQGSDYHGAHMPWIKLGCFAPLPAGCKGVWELF